METSQREVVICSILCRKNETCKSSRRKEVAVAVKAERERGRREAEGRNIPRRYLEEEEELAVVLAGK